MMQILGEAKNATQYPRLIDYLYVQPKTKFPAIGSGKIKRRFVYRAISIRTLVDLVNSGRTKHFHGGGPGISVVADNK